MLTITIATSKYYKALDKSQILAVIYKLECKGRKNHEVESTVVVTEDNLSHNSLHITNKRLAVIIMSTPLPYCCSGGYYSTALQDSTVLSQPWWKQQSFK